MCSADARVQPTASQSASELRIGAAATRVLEGNEVHWHVSVVAGDVVGTPLALGARADALELVWQRGLRR